MARSDTNRAHSYTTYLTLEAPNKEELEQRGFMNPVGYRRIEIVWCETSDDVKRYEMAGFEEGKRLREDERVVEATISVIETVAGTNGFATCFVRRTSWLACDMDEAKHEQWHRNNDPLAGMFSGIFGGVEGQA